MKIFSNYIRDVVFLLLTTIWHQALTIVIWEPNNLNPEECAPVFSIRQLIYEKNEEIIITCRSISPVIWLYPKITHAHNFESHTIINKMKNRRIIAGFPYYSQLVVHNATFAHTGFYGCQCNSTNKKSSSAYVYVKDPDHLLTFSEYDVFNIENVNTTTLSWCRPTSPDIHVAITLEGKTIVNTTNVSYPFTYDPRYGFTVENIKETIVDGNYTCEATDSSRVEYKNMEVQVIAAPFISIKTVKEFYKPDEPISIECHIFSSSLAHVRLEWNNNKIVTKEIESNAVLTYNTTAKQSGFFFCIALNKHGIKYEMLKVFVTDLKKDVCDVWRNESNGSIYVGEQITLECGATNQIYRDRIQWYFNDSLLDINQLPKDYKIVNYDTSYSHRSLLIITDVKYANAGNYECQLRPKSQSCGQIKVDVQGKPSLSCSNFDQNKTYDYDDIIIFQCSAMSKPLPSNVECIYKAADWTDKISTTFVEFDRQTVTFNLILSPYESGKIHCNVTNEVGTSEMSLDVNIANVLYSSIYYEKFIIRNDSIIIPCIPNHPAVIVKLMHNDKVIASSVNASSPYSYDPNVGFTIENSQEYLNSSEYYCLFGRQKNHTLNRDWLKNDMLNAK